MQAGIQCAPWLGGGALRSRLATVAHCALGAHAEISGGPGCISRPSLGLVFGARWWTNQDPLSTTVVVASVVCELASTSTKTVPLVTQSPVSAEPIDPPLAKRGPEALPT